MSSIELVNLTKRFGSLIAVDDLDLEIRDKEFVALLGPSGCGKTTTMNMISGILAPDEGEIRFDGRDVSRVAPGKRDVGFVFQNYAIFTHMTAYKNLAFGLEVRRLPRAEIDRRVHEIARLLNLQDRLSVPASRLGVNEMQRLGLGRSAIVNPKIFLLDEPLSNLDAAFRAVMRTELKHLQHQLGQTMVYVTHDQLEAMSMADRIAVMDLGRLQQFGTPLEIYNRPRNLFVAKFMGSPAMNLMPGRLGETNGATTLDFAEGGALTVTDDAMLAQCRAAKQPDVVYGLRPEEVVLGPPDPAAADLAMTVDFVETVGPHTVVHLRSGNHQIKALESNEFRGELGTAMTVRAKPGTGRLFDAGSGLAVILD